MQTKRLEYCQKAKFLWSNLFFFKNYQNIFRKQSRTYKKVNIYSWFHASLLKSSDQVGFMGIQLVMSIHFNIISYIFKILLIISSRATKLTWSKISFVLFSSLYIKAHFCITNVHVFLWRSINVLSIIYQFSLFISKNKNEKRS